jgi:hypothetical protein
MIYHALDIRLLPNREGDTAGFNAFLLFVPWALAPILKPYFDYAAVCHRGRSGMAVPPPGHRRLRPRMRLAPNLQQPSFVDVGITLRRRQAGMAQQVLDRAQVGAAGQQMCGEGMP